MLAFAREPRRCDPTDLMPALTGIRLPLALWVVVHHISDSGGMFGPLSAASPALRALIEAAWVALSAFFAISGFVLARRYRGTVWNRDALARFAAARFGRIYPVYFLSLLIMLPIIWEALRQDNLGSLAQRAGLLLNYLLLLQGWRWPSTNWNTPAWSLSCEVFFYACAPIVVGSVRRTSSAGLLATAGLACAVPIGLRLLIDPPVAKALLYFGDFLIGVAAAGFYDHYRDRRMPLRRLGPWIYWPTFAVGIALLLSRDALGSFLLFDTGVRLVSGLLVFGLACGGGWLTGSTAPSLVSIVLMRLNDDRLQRRMAFKAIRDYFSDPFGNRIELMEPRSGARHGCSGPYSTKFTRSRQTGSAPARMN